MRDSRHGRYQAILGQVIFRRVRRFVGRATDAKRLCHADQEGRIMKKLAIVTAVAALAIGFAAMAEAQGKGKGKGVGNARKVVSGQIFVRKGGGDSTAFRVTRSDRRNKERSGRILDNSVFATDVFHGLPPGLGKRHDNLPHGLAKRRIDSLLNLPQGLAKDHPIPPGLTNRTELPPGLSN